jgi:pilus assembly protein CpaB
MAAAQAAGKIQLATVPRAQVLAGAVNSATGLEDKIALSTVYPKEQIITAKFGSAGEQSTLTIPDGSLAVSVNLSDTGRVSGFISPGAKVAVFLTTSGDEKLPDATRLLLPEAQVVAVGETTVVATTKTDEAGAQTTEQLPKTLFTLALSQEEAEKVTFATSRGELSFGLLNDKTKVDPGPGVQTQNLFG